MNETLNEEVILSIAIIADTYSSSLEKCINSILNQNLPSIEILLLSNNPNADFINIHDKIKASNKRKLKIITYNSYECDSIKRNKSLLESRGKYIWHFEQDSYLPNNYVASELIKFLEENNTPAICFDYIIETDYDQEKESIFSESLNSEIVSTKHILENKKIDSISSFVFERKLALDLNIYDLEYEYLKINHILKYQIIKAFQTVSLVDLPVYIKRESNHQILNNKWNFFDFLSDRLNIYFFNETFGKSEKLNIALSARKKFISNTLLKKLRKDLPIELANLLEDIFKIDHKFLSGNILRYKDNFLLNKKYGKIKINEIFDYIFKDTEFVLHLGAHKTATTFIQNIISKNKYDLALEGILFIDLDLYREYVKFSRSDHIDLKEFILFAILPTLFIKPKRVIISDENILIGTGSVETGQNINPYFYSGCSPSGFNTNNLENILNNLKNCKIFFAFRDYAEYIISRHSEASIFRGYRNIDKLTKDWNFEKSCNWIYITNYLKSVVAKFENVSLYLTRYEDYQSDPIQFAEILCGQKIKIKELTDSESRSIKRSRATKEIIEYVEDLQSREKDSIAVKRIYGKLLDFGYGSNKYIPNFIKKDFFKVEDKNSLVYEKHCSIIKLIDLDKENKKLKFENSKKSFNECSKIKDIQRHFKIETKADIEDAPMKKFIKSVDFKNIENNHKYNFSRSNFNKKKGITAMLRIKNEEKNIRSVILSIKDVFDEIIVVDNGSTDKTKEIINEISTFNPLIQKKIKIYDYPFNVSRCGLENLNTDRNSLKSLAYFYNYALSKCNCEYVMKWDGDMILQKTMINEMRDFIDNLITSKNYLLGIPKGLTVFKGLNGLYYYKKDRYEAEIRIFKNITQNYFEKDILWERFQSNTDAKLILSSNPIYIEYKDLNQNEFSHWGIDSLGMSPRKRDELSNFKKLAQLTKNENCDIEELHQNQFEIYPFQIM